MLRKSTGTVTAGRGGDGATDAGAWFVFRVTLAGRATAEADAPGADADGEPDEAAAAFDTDSPVGRVRFAIGALFSAPAVVEARV